MAVIPNPVRLFHITAISNLESIVRDRGLLAKNEVAKQGKPYQNIAYQSIQATRASKVVSVAPGGLIHDYVPFYFAPRSPMLFTLKNGNVPGFAAGQADIVHLESTVDRLSATGRPYVFYDRNASLRYSKPYNNLADLNQIAWDLLTEHPQMDGYCAYWQSRHDPPRYADRMELRQAEFLVHSKVPLTAITRIGVATAEKRHQVAAHLAALGAQLPVEAIPAWYF